MWQRFNLLNFRSLEDPRVEQTKRHQLIDIVTISICAVICGADTWVDIESYGRSKYEWLKKFLELPNGIPTHDTIARVFSRLNPVSQMVGGGEKPGFCEHIHLT